MAELRGELKEEIAGLRQDMTVMRGELKEEIAGLRLDTNVLAKSLEAHGQRMDQGSAETRRELGQMQASAAQQVLQVDRQFRDLRQDIRELRTTMQRQMWVLITTVVVTLSGGMIKLTFFP